MKSDGKGLERLVAFVERTLAADGAEVKTNERIFNDQGIQIAEFDVQVHGRFGSTEVRWLIQCRDRPSEGPAGGEWIEQLVGRRDRFGFNKVTAVSTTGFSAGAIDFATSSGVEFREVTSLTPEEFVPWCALRVIQSFGRNASLQSATIVVSDSETDEKKRAFEHLLADTPPAHVLLRSVPSGQAGPLVDAFLSVVIQNNLFEGMGPKSAAKPVELVVDYPTDSHFVIDTEAGAVRIQTIVFRGELRVESSIVPLTDFERYRTLGSVGPVLETAVFEPQRIFGQHVSVEIHRLGPRGEIRLGLRPIADEKSATDTGENSHDGDE